MVDEDPATNVMVLFLHTPNHVQLNLILSRLGFLLIPVAAQDTALPDSRACPASTSRGSSNAATFDDRRRFHFETRDGQRVCHRFLLKMQCSFGNQCRYAHALRDIFQIEKRPFDGLDMVPEFSGRRSSHDQDRHTSDRRANFQGHMTILAFRFAGKRNLLMTTTADQRFRFRERQRIGRSSS